MSDKTNQLKSYNIKNHTDQACSEESIYSFILALTWPFPCWYTKINRAEMVKVGGAYVLFFNICKKNIIAFAHFWAFLDALVQFLSGSKCCPYYLSCKSKTNFRKCFALIPGAFIKKHMFNLFLLSKHDRIETESKTETKVYWITF